METSKRAQALSVIAAVLFVAVAMTAGYRRIGVPPVVIVGGSSLVALVLWIKTYLRRPLDPEIILPGNGRFVADMHNYWVKTTGVYYFPGMYTAILPMIPGIYTIRRVLKGAKS